MSRSRSSCEAPKRAMRCTILSVADGSIGLTEPKPAVLKSLRFTRPRNRLTSPPMVQCEEFSIHHLKRGRSGGFDRCMDAADSGYLLNKTTQIYTKLHRLHALEVSNSPGLGGDKWG